MGGGGGSRGIYRVLVCKVEGKDYLEDPGVDGKIILKWTFRKWGMGTWTGLIWLMIRDGCRAVKRGEFLD